MAVDVPAAPEKFSFEAQVQSLTASGIPLDQALAMAKIERDRPPKCPICTVRMVTGRNQDGDRTCYECGFLHYRMMSVTTPAGERQMLVHITLGQLQYEAAERARFWREGPNYIPPGRKMATGLVRRGTTVPVG